MTLCLAIYGHYLTMAIKARHTFSVNLGELAYVAGMGRGALVFMTLINVASFIMNAALYLNIVRSVVFGLNC